jgi:hypothetical protein
MIHVSNMSDDLIAVIWYSPSEYAAIRRQNAQTLKYMTTGIAQTTSDSIHCTRGLEQRTKRSAHIKHELKVSTLIAVLGEQETLRKNGVTGDAACIGLARAYRRVSAESQTVAFVQGLKDEQEVQEHLLLRHGGNGSNNLTTAMSVMINASCGNGDSFASISLDDGGEDASRGDLFSTEKNSAIIGERERDEQHHSTSSSRRRTQPLLCGAAA